MILHDILDFIYPPVCHLCGTRLAPHEKYICTGCIADLPRTLYHRKPDNQMERRFAGIFPFERAAGHFFYAKGSNLSMLMQDLKYRKFRGLARYLGEIVGMELYSTAFFSDIDYVVPVPMHFMKKARRGYNQTEEMAKGIFKATGIPFDQSLKAIKPHRTQTALTHAQRLKNTSGIFRLTDADKINHRHILLLDDVCTTGSTLISAAESILKEAPDTRISLLTIGVTF